MEFLVDRGQSLRFDHEVRERLPRERGVLGFLLYFLFIGCGYILIEVGLIQKFVLFLGHPTYALTVVIFSLLISSGLGSYDIYLAERF